ncbi:MAG: ABC transporter ATP-binding protein [Lachnospiraceae bacterium]|nr:ABC transporter ATP-binding protein [Lachnospiraceae bacterium]
MLKTLAKQIKQYKKASVLSILFTALEVFMDVLIPVLMARIIDRGIESGDLKQVFIYGGLMLVCVLFGLFSGIMSGRFAAHASTGFACNLREAMFLNIQTFSFANLDKFSTAGLVTRLTTDVTNLQMAYQMLIRMTIRAPFMLVLSLTMTLLICPKISVVFLAASLFLGVVLFNIIRIVRRVFDEVFKRYDDLNASVQENVTGIRVVKAFVREDFENTKFKKAAENLYRLFVKAEGTLAFNSPVMMTAVYGCILGISWMGAKLVVGGELTTGNLTSLFSYVMSILMSLMMLSMVFVMMTMSVASGERIAEVLAETSSLTNGEHPVTEVKDGSISFRHVNFAYYQGEDKNVLNDINLEIKSGETVGIIGGTGSSKTSLINLISRLYDVTGGSVLVGGTDVREYDLETLRDQVSVVLQKNVLFSGTILENLRWGNENATEEECRRVCRIACADDFIQAFPEQYNTRIERGGNNVSGGQKQRLCIARALLKKPKILILDDSTSAVDTATDARIRKAFREEIPDTTKIIIAQRISSVQEADHIVVLDEGRINGYGTHEELLKSNEIYASIYENQTSGGGDFDQKGGE